MQTGLSLRERRRIEEGILKSETLPEERFGLAGALLLVVFAASAGLRTGTLPALWDAPIFGALTVATSMLMQVILSPTCLDGQGYFGARIRDTGWLTYTVWRQIAAARKQPLVRRTRDELRRLSAVAIARACILRERVGALLRRCWRPIVAWVERAGIITALRQLRDWWRQTPPAAGIRRVRAHVKWNWRQYSAKVESQRTQDWMAEQLNVMIEQRKRAEGESR